MPDAWFLNYTNPMSMIIWAVTSQSAVKTVGLCHSVYWTVHAIAEYIGVPVGEIDHVSAGVNHLAFLLRLERDGEDLYPRLGRRSATAASPTTTSSGPSSIGRLGFYPTESSEHHAEYNPWFIPKGQVDRFHIPIGEYLTRVSRNLDEYDETKRKARGRRALRDRAERRVRGGDHQLRRHRRAARIVGNVPNRGR